MFFSQCRKKGKLLGTYTFTTEDLKIVPYNGGETIILIDSLGDTIKYIVNNPRVKDFYIYYNIDDPNLDPDHVSMVDYYKTEVNQTSTLGYFNIKLKFSSPFNSPLKKVIIFSGLVINNHPEIKGYFTGVCVFDVNSLFQNNSTLQLNENESNLQVTILDSLKIINKTFYSVYALTQSTNGADTVDCINTIYYNISQGIVGIKTKQNRIWCLNN